MCPKYFMWRWGSSFFWRRGEGVQFFLRKHVRPFRVQLAESSSSVAVTVVQIWSNPSWLFFWETPFPEIPSHFQACPSPCRLMSFLVEQLWAQHSFKKTTGRHVSVGSSEVFRGCSSVGNAWREDAPSQQSPVQSHGCRFWSTGSSLTNTSPHTL